MMEFKGGFVGGGVVVTGGGSWLFAWEGVRRKGGGVACGPAAVVAVATRDRPLIRPILNDVSLRHKKPGNVIWERAAYTTETKLLDFFEMKNNK